MINIFESASKIVFIMLIATACVGFLMKLLPVESFMIVAMAAVSFYFSNKGDSSKDNLGK